MSSDDHLPGPLSPHLATLILPATDADSDPFINIVSRLTISLAADYHWPWIYAVHVDTWFGSRWLGFRGKILGVAGVRNRTLENRLVVPPFHPNRVLDAVGYHVQSNGSYVVSEDLATLHSIKSSELNLRNWIRRGILHVWYSGNTVSTQKGALMVYFESTADVLALYLQFDGARGWHLDQHIGISRSDVMSLLDRNGFPVSS